MPLRPSPYHKKHSRFSYVVAIGLAAALGVGAAFILFTSLNYAADLAINGLDFSGSHTYQPDRPKLDKKIDLTAAVFEAAPDDGVITKLVFVGDIMLDRGVKRSVIKNGAGDYNHMFHRVPFLAEADIAFANLEGPVSDQGVDKHNLYSFRMEPKVIEALTNSGIDVVSMANNHVGDWGLSAFVDTLKRLKDGGLVYVGGGLNQADAEQVKIIEKNGVKFGFVGFSDVGPLDLGAGPEMPGINLATDETVARVVKQASLEADVVIASFHFGEEYQPLPNERQKHLARLAIDSGAKIVVGHHPHVIEPVEMYHDGVIVYSLGNFIFDQYFSESTMTGGVLQVDFSDKNIAAVNTLAVKLNNAFVPELIKP